MLPEVFPAGLPLRGQYMVPISGDAHTRREKVTIDFGRVAYLSRVSSSATSSSQGEKLNKQRGEAFGVVAD